MIIAITGGLGSGKSTVSKILAGALGVKCLDTDQLCRQEMLPGREGFAKFQEVYGTQFLQADGTLNRLLLRQAVFSNRNIREEIEKILHPVVRRHVADITKKAIADGRHLVVEVPLLFEAGWQHDFDVTVVVYVPEELSLARVSARDGLSASDIKRVFASQLPIALKLQYAHFVIDNAGTFVSTVQQIGWLEKKLQGDKKNWELNGRSAKKLDSKDLNTYKGNNDLKLNPCLC